MLCPYRIGVWPLLSQSGNWTLEPGPILSHQGQPSSKPATPKGSQAHLPHQLQVAVQDGNRLDVGGVREHVDGLHRGHPVARRSRVAQVAGERVGLHDT